MGRVIITIKLMPESPEINWEEKTKEVKNIISKYGEFGGVKIEPVAFGLKSLNVFFMVSEDMGNPDNIASELKKIEGVESAEVTDVRRDFM